jgi:hypothetical protein
MNCPKCDADVLADAFAALRAKHERLNMAEDALAYALAHLEGEPGYAHKQSVIDYLKAYFVLKKSGPLQHGETP